MGRVVVECRGVLAEVLSDAEGPARPGQDDRAHVGVGGYLLERRNQRFLDLDRQRVVAVGPVERDGGDRVGAVDEYDVVGHRSSSRMGRPSDRLRPRNSATTFSPHLTLTS